MRSGWLSHTSSAGTLDDPEAGGHTVVFSKKRHWAYGKDGKLKSQWQYFDGELMGRKTD